MAMGVGVGVGVSVSVSVSVRMREDARWFCGSVVLWLSCYIWSVVRSSGD